MGGEAVAVSAPRVVVSLGAGATAEVVEDFGAPLLEGPTFVNTVFEADLQEVCTLHNHPSLPVQATFLATVAGPVFHLAIYAVRRAAVILSATIGSCLQTAARTASRRVSKNSCSWQLLDVISRFSWPPARAGGAGGGGGVVPYYINLDAPSFGVHTTLR